MTSEKPFEQYKAQFKNEVRLEIEQEYKVKMEQLKVNLEEKFKEDMEMLKESLKQKEQEIEKVLKTNEELKRHLAEKENTIADSVKELKEKLTKCREELSLVDVKMAKLMTFCDQLLNNNEEDGGVSIKDEGSAKTDDESAIVGSDFAIGMVSSFLDPQSFTRLIRSKKRLYTLAKHGSLTVPLKLSILTENMEEIPYFQNLDIPKMISLSKANWFRIELDGLRILPQHQVSHYEREIYAYKLERLLRWANIKHIDRMKIYHDSTDYEFLKFCTVRRFKAEFISLAKFLDYPNIYKSEEIYVTFLDSMWNRRTTYAQAREEKKRMMAFIEKSPAHSFDVEELDSPISFVVKMMEMWQTGQKNFKKMHLHSVVVDGHDHLVSEFWKKNEIFYAGSQLQNVSSDDVRQMIDEVKPMIVIGLGETVVIIRDDLQMMSVNIHYYGNSKYCSALLDILV